MEFWVMFGSTLLWVLIGLTLVVGSILVCDVDVPIFLILMVTLFVLVLTTMITQKRYDKKHRAPVKVEAER